MCPTARRRHHSRSRFAPCTFAFHVGPRAQSEDRASGVAGVQGGEGERPTWTMAMRRQWLGTHQPTSVQDIVLVQQVRAVGHTGVIQGPTPCRMYNVPQATPAVRQQAARSPRTSLGSGPVKRRITSSWLKFCLRKVRVRVRLVFRAERGRAGVQSSKITGITTTSASVGGSTTAAAGAHQTGQGWQCEGQHGG